MKKTSNKPKDLVSTSTNPLMMQPDLIKAAKEVIASGDEVALITWAVNTVLVTANQFTMAIDGVLINKMNFTEDQINAFHNHLRDDLGALASIRSYGSHPIMPNDIKVLGEIAKEKYPEEKKNVLMKKLGVAVPSKIDPNKYLSLGADGQHNPKTVGITEGEVKKKKKN